MATNEFLQKIVGQWKGNSRLHLPWLEESKKISSGLSEVHIDLDEQKKYATVSYWWTYEGERQEGVMTVVCHESRKKVFIGWVDSWHMNYDLMKFTGELETNRVSGFGKYWVGENEPEWGWRITLSLEGDSLKIAMDNVTPDDKSEWAVEGIYNRN